jgi:site-specific recombinase XerC
MAGHRGQLEQHREAGGALDQGADRGAAHPQDEGEPLAAHRFHVDQWVATLIEHELRPATIQRMVSTVRNYHAWAVEQDIIAKCSRTASCPASGIRTTCRPWPWPWPWPWP